MTGAVLNAVTGAVLELISASAEPELPLTDTAQAEDIYEAGGVVYMTQPLNRPEELPGKTYKLRWPDSPHAIYITVNDVVRDGRRAPFEVFINSKNMEHYAWTVALTRMISAVFRRGGDAPALGQCPKCGSPGLIRAEGCDLCTSCGYSRCA